MGEVMNKATKQRDYALVFRARWQPHTLYVVTAQIGDTALVVVKGARKDLSPAAADRVRLSVAVDNGYDVLRYSREQLPSLQADYKTVEEYAGKAGEDFKEGWFMPIPEPGEVR